MEQKIHEEWTRNLFKNRPDLKYDKIQKLVTIMNEVFPDAEVQMQDIDLENVSLSDENDIHVLLAAIKGKADYIVTFNLRDFPPTELQKHKLKAIHPDDFLVECIKQSPESARFAFRNQVKLLQNPKLTP